MPLILHNDNTHAFNSRLLLIACFIFSLFAPLALSTPIENEDDWPNERLVERLHKTLNLAQPSEVTLPPEFHPDRFLFGEEFEYWIDLENNNSLYSRPANILEIWKEKLEQKLKALNISESDFHLEIRDGPYFPAEPGTPDNSFKEIRELFSGFFTESEFDKMEAEGLDSADEDTQVNFRKVVTRFNQLVPEGYSAKPYDLFSSYLRLTFMWESLFHDGHKPANMKFGQLKTKLENNSVERGEIIARPRGTLELRFLPTARTGNEARLINQMILSWFTQQHQNQQIGKAISYHPHDPEKSPSGYTPYKQFADFIQSLGLNITEYAVFSREGCQPPPAPAASIYFNHSISSDTDDGSVDGLQ